MTDVTGLPDVTDLTALPDVTGLPDLPALPDVTGLPDLPALPDVTRPSGSVVLASDYFHSYSVIGLLAVIGVLFVAVAFGAGRLLRPVVPTPEKLLTYECGVDPVGEGWAHTQVRYYVYAFLYVIFAVDSIFLFPWATVFAAPGYGATTLVEMFIFLGFLAVGLLYAWKKGVLEWT